MKSPALLLVAAIALFGPLAANSADIWRSPDGAAVPETPSRKAIDGFGVWLVITADSDWREKWDTPSHVTPNFTEAKNVSIGGHLTILTLVVNPRPDTLGELNVKSRVLVTRPNGTTSVNAAGLRCLAGKLAGPATNVRLCEAILQFSADPGDPPGLWQVQVTVRDENRASEVPVEGNFMLQVP